MKDVEIRGYGINFILRKYCKFPLLLPLPCHAEHGWTALPNALESDLKVKKPLMLVFSKRREQAWKRKSKSPVKIMGVPFILYKNLMNLKPAANRSGTVVFPSHSTYDLKAEFDIKGFCQSLERLPKKFHPVTICLFWVDYIDKAATYRGLGYNVVTAGPRFTNSLKFVSNFYKILSEHEYSCSNEVGSYTFYAVDFNIPFFLVGEDPKVVNQGGKDVNIGMSARLSDYKDGQIATSMFRTGPISSISQSQREYVQKETGKGDLLSPTEMNKLLWKHYRQQDDKIKQVILYYVDSIINALLFNMPWTTLVISIRSRLK